MALFAQCKRSEETGLDWRLDKTVKRFLKKRGAQIPLIDGLDYILEKENWWKVYHQGSTSSCVGFALAHGVLWYHIVKSGRFKGEPIDLKPSPRFVWEAAKEIDQSVKYPTSFLLRESTSLKSGLRVLRKYGVLMEAEYPIYDMPPHSGKHSIISRKTASAIFTKAAQYRILTYINLEPGNEVPLHKYHQRFADNIDFWLKHQGPIAISFALSAELSINNSPKEPIEGPPNLQKNQAIHAASLCGIDENGHYILRNSWGRNWGIHGYALVSREFLFGIEEGGKLKYRGVLSEAYGVVF